jgi:hypothetical protein
VFFFCFDEEGCWNQRFIRYWNHTFSPGKIAARNMSQVLGSDPLLRVSAGAASMAHKSMLCVARSLQSSSFWGACWVLAHLD